MKGNAFFRSIMLGLICVVFLSAGNIMRVAAQPASDDRITLDQQKQILEKEGKGRDLSQLSSEELARLKEGGPLSERVVKIGISTFILNLALAYTIVAIAAFIISMFFTPLGFWLFRGNLHSFIGSILKASGLSKKFGEMLMKEPKRLMGKHKSVRAAFAEYMHNEFIPNYKNNITAVAFMGTAFLIFSIGVRGLKFIVAHQPGLILYAICVEVTVLLLLGLTTWYEKEEEEEDGEGQGFAGKQLTLEEVERKLDALKGELEQSVQTETRLRH
jgi:hypothetical protein